MLLYSYSVFRYVKERADEERREKRNKMKERKDEFRKLLEEADLNGKSTFSDFAAKYGKDDRFRNVDKTRERESLFDEYLLEVRRREKEEKAAKREQVRLFFIFLNKSGQNILIGYARDFYEKFNRWHSFF